MLIRLIPPSPHPTILYGLTFPHVLSLHGFCPIATMPAAWSSQLQLLTSVLQLEPPSNIHMLDRAVGLVARVHEVTMDVQQKEFVLRFVDGRVTHFPMNSDCVRMLLGVVVDVKGCSEPESQRNSMESSACPGSTPGSAEDLPSGRTKSPKPGKHKRQKSLLFSLISSLVPKSFSSSSPPPPSSAPPPAPLPPLPVSGRVTSPFSPQQTNSVLEHPEHLRRRARATLIEVWRRYVLSAVTPQHLPAAGYLEWTLISMASKVRAEIESSVTSTKPNGAKHRRTQSESRNALDFGDRSDICELEQWRCRAPSPFPDIVNGEDADQVVYPRRDQADEWGVRYVHHSRSIDEVDVFSVEYNGQHDSLLGEHFTVGDDWDDTERLTFELSRMGHHGSPGIGSRLSSFEDRHLLSGEFVLDWSEDSGLADTAFDMSRCPLTPSDVNDDEQSDDSQISLRTPEDGEGLPLAIPSLVPQSSTEGATPQPPLVYRVNSSRPRSRNASAQFSSAPPTSSPARHTPTPPIPPSSSIHCRNVHVDEYIASRLAFLDRICTALEVVRSRSREEGWRLVRATMIGARNGWMDAEMEGSLEIKAKRRAWSSGIKISAPYFPSRSASRVWDGSSSTFRSPLRPPGLASSLRKQARRPIVPTGLSLGIPTRSSPLAMYVWNADDGQKSTPSKYGILSLGHSLETIDGKRSPRVTFAENVAKLFPVCEDEGEDLFEPVQDSAIGFPQTIPRSVTADEPENTLIEGPAGREDDPFYFCPSRPRTRTKSMYMIPPASSSPSPVLPMFRPSTPPPSYQAAVGGDVSTAENNEEEKLDASALLLQPLSSLSITSPQSPPSRPSLISNPPFIPRPRAISLPTPRPDSNTNKTRRVVSSHHKDEHCEDLSRVYASPPPEGPVVVSATPAPHEQYLRYAHVHSPIPSSRRNINATLPRKTGKEVMFEQGGSEFTVGIEIALGRAEEGRVVW